MQRSGIGHFFEWLVNIISPPPRRGGRNTQSRRNLRVYQGLITIPARYFCRQARGLGHRFPLFKERRIVPTHYTIRTSFNGPGRGHLKWWLVETSVDGESWQEVAREEGNDQLNGSHFTGTFAVAGGGECSFIRLVAIGRNHYGTDGLFISAWEIFGSLIE
jgi:hypothetical protein